MFCLWSFEITKYCLWSKWSPSCNFLFVLCLVLCLPSCVEVWELELCTPRFVSCNSSVEIPLWKVLSGYSENPSVWRRGRRAVAQISKHILVFAFGSLYLLTLYSYILYRYYCSYLYMFDIVCVLTLVFNQESYWSTSSPSLEESWGEVLKLFMGNLASLLVTHCMC